MADELDRKLDAAARNTQQKRDRGMYAAEAGFIVGPTGEDELFIHYADGRRFYLPARLLDGVSDMTPEQRRTLELDPSGWYLHWDSPEWDAYIPALIGDSAMEWMQREVARRNGQKTSPAKAASSRANGKKGGRPRKVKVITLGKPLPR